MVTSASMDKVLFLAGKENIYLECHLVDPVMDLLHNIFFGLKDMNCRGIDLSKCLFTPRIKSCLT